MGVRQTSSKLMMFLCDFHKDILFLVFFIYNHIYIYKLFHKMYLLAGYILLIFVGLLIIILHILICYIFIYLFTTILIYLF